MSRAADAAARINQHVSIENILAAYGYRVRPGGGREQQFSCDLHGDGRDGRPSARVYPDSNSWYCVAVNERVLTARGWEELGAIPASWGSAGGTIPAHDGTSWQHPTAYMPRGTREVVRVKTKAGYAVTVTPDHEIEVVGRGWVAAADIRPGDVLVVPKPEQPRFPPRAPNDLWSITNSLNQETYGSHPNLRLPSEWSTEVGEALGYVFGDGWVVPRKSPASGMVGITAHAEDAEDVRAVFKHMQEWSAGRGSEAHRTDIAVVHGKEYVQNQFVFTIGNDGFCTFFQRLGLGKEKAPDNRRLPGSLWQAPECAVRGFLRGVYGADGSVFRPTGRKGIKVNLYSVSGPFLRDVQLLLLQFGIHSRLYPPSKTRVKSGKREGKRTHPSWYLQLATGRDILTFRERIGIASTRKQAVLDSYSYNTRGARPFKPVVESVEPAGTAKVADISMPVEHSFIAGGIKVHNCFACDKTRDAIETVREKEGLDFWQAVHLLEKTVGLDPLPTNYAPRSDTAAEIRQALDPEKTFEDDRERARRFLDAVTADRTLPLPDLLRFWEMYDKVVYLVVGTRNEGGSLPEPKGRLLLLGIIEKVKEAEKNL